MTVAGRSEISVSMLATRLKLEGVLSTLSASSRAKLDGARFEELYDWFLWSLMDFVRSRKAVRVSTVA